MTKELFGKKLKELRDAAGQKQPELGKILDVGPKQIQRYEDGLVPEHEKIQILCDLYNYDFLSLIYDVSREKNSVDFQAKYYDKIEKDNKRLESENNDLKKQLSSCEDQIRVLALQTHSIVETNQDSLAQVMAKLKIDTIGKVTELHRKANLASLSKIKGDLGIP